MTQKNTRTTALVAVFALLAGALVLMLGLQKHLSQNEMLHNVSSSVGSFQTKPLLQDVR